MPNLSSVFLLLYFCAIIGVGIYVLVLLGRFVNAHERMASAVERAAQSLERERK